MARGAGAAQAPQCRTHLHAFNDAFIPLLRYLPPAVQRGARDAGIGRARALAKLGAEPAPPTSAAQFAALVRADKARWATLIRERKITSD